MGTYHPSLECFMADVEPEREPTPKGFVEEASDDKTTPPEDIRDGAGYCEETPSNEPP